jgi:hypothetical protein
MERFISEYYKNVEIISPDDSSHYFFAYYDMRASQGKRHLCHKVSFLDRIPNENDVAEIGYLEDKKFYKIAETTAWNFQQGALLQYHPFKADTVYYNTIKDGKAVTVTHNYVSGEKHFTDRALACISEDGALGLSINFGRVFDFRAGYGYAACKDENFSVNAPTDDGVFLCNMETGKSHLIFNYEEIRRVSGYSEDEKILVNHITFNKSGDKFILLVRNFPKGTQWSTSLMVGDADGNLKLLLEKTYVSHYNWLDSQKILVHCTVSGQKGLFLIDTKTGKAEEYFDPFLRENDIHCLFSPDKKYIIGDGYQIGHHRPLVAYSVESGKLRKLCSVLTNEVPVDARCDLHARFVFGGEYISFDTVQNGKREIAIIPTDALDF